MLTVAPGSWAGGTSANSVVSGSGGVAYTVGLGGSGGDTGSEAATLTASAAKRDTITVGAESGGKGLRASLTGFVASEAPTTDYLKFSAPKTPLADVTTPAAIGTTTYTVSNGVITFASVTNANTQLRDAQDIVNAAGANAVAATVLGGSTYVIASGASALTGVTGANADALIAMVGVTGVKGFGTTPAENTIYTGTTVGSVTPAVALVNTGTSAASVYDAKGVSAVTLTNSSHVITIGSTSTTLNNLAASAIISDASTLAVTKVITSQVGTAGKNSLTYNSTGAHTVAELNVSGANSLTLKSDANTVYTSIVDGGSTNTLTSISVTGAANTTLSGVTDTVLASVSALDSTGTLTLNSDKVGLSVTGSSRANNITSSGANSVVTVTHNYDAGGTKLTNADSQVITANGSGASVTLSESGSPAMGTNTYTITANGSGATVDTSGFRVVGSVAPVITTSGGTGATIKVGAGISGTVIGVNVGTGNTVTLVDGYDAAALTVPHVNINLAAASAGDTSTGTYTLTKVVGTTVATNTLTFPALGAAKTYTWNNVPVNVAANTTLEGALNQAATGTVTAGNGYINWFQYGGDTYIVDNVAADANATATTGFDASDIIVKITGLIDLSGVSVLGTANTAAVIPLG
jgi:S-layer protein